MENVVNLVLKVRKTTNLTINKIWYFKKTPPNCALLCRVVLDETIPWVRVIFKSTRDSFILLSLVQLKQIESFHNTDTCELMLMLSDAQYVEYILDLLLEVPVLSDHRRHRFVWRIQCKESSFSLGISTRWSCKS